MKRFRHDARRETMWVGKGVKAPWVLVAGIVAVAAVAALLLNG